MADPQTTEVLERVRLQMEALLSSLSERVQEAGVVQAWLQEPAKPEPGATRLREGRLQSREDRLAATQRRMASRSVLFAMDDTLKILKGVVAIQKLGKGVGPSNPDEFLALMKRLGLERSKVPDSRIRELQAEGAAE